MDKFVAGWYWFPPESCSFSSKRWFFLLPQHHKGGLNWSSQENFGLFTGLLSQRGPPNWSYFASRWSKRLKTYAWLTHWNGVKKMQLAHLHLLNTPPYLGWVRFYHVMSMDKKFIPSMLMVGCLKRRCTDCIFIHQRLDVIFPKLQYKGSHQKIR